MWKALHHRRDSLAGEYAKGMQHFGCGEDLFQPVGGAYLPPRVSATEI